MRAQKVQDEEERNAQEAHEEEWRAHEAREDEQRGEQEAREDEVRARAQEAREGKIAQEEREEEARAHEEREKETRAQEEREKEAKAQEERREEERTVQAKQGHEGKAEMTTPGECVEEKKERKSMQEESDVSNRHMTWWKNAWWIRVDGGPHMRTARGRRRIWWAARSAAEQARDDDGIEETQSFAEEAEGEKRGKRGRQNQTRLCSENTLHIV